VAALLALAAAPAAPGQDEADDTAAAAPARKPKPLPADTFSGLRARSIGPAVSSGRIGDVAVNPRNRAHFFAAAASGGVWKTINAGTTWKPVFDGQGSYSIGCLAMDPHNENVIWVGTGENNSQRSVSFGDGVYRSRDGGASWQHVGLRESEHIGMIAIDPRDTDTVYVAAQGPLWRAGGDRGLYKTTDGGRTWQRILHVSDDTGMNEVHLDPRDPDVVYASSYQRRRRVWTLINGGPESTVHKSTDGGATWRTIARGLPGGDKGRIGLDISPANPDVLYAIVEASGDSGGFYRSTNRGETWQRRSGYMTSSPQYYNEVVCDPRDVDRVFVLDTFLMVSDDGGRTMTRMVQTDRHVDHHALWLDPDDPGYMLVGCDGGVYQSFDRGATWDYRPNLPITQFYRVTVDDSEPFYYVYGGTQDNNTLGGPSRTTSPVGIANEDWFVTVGGDGFETRVDPEDPNIVYSQWQYGGLVRYDRRSGETVDIRPRERPGEAPNRWNWDSPLIISPHDHHRLYFGSQRLYRSDDRGDGWEAVSGDLTRQLDRNQLEVMGRIQPADAVAKNMNTSIFGNLVALAESPRVEGLIYAGTDDGLVQVTEVGGGADEGAWRRIGLFPGVPDMSYVSGLTASLHEDDRVFACFDNHKSGDFAPYLLRSDDRGETWESIVGDLPDRHIVYAIAEDHEDPDLLFAATEFAAFFTLDGGEQWIKIGGLPTIAVRDIDIQRRENDVVMGTFGRSFYVLDDYTPLRVFTRDMLEQDAVLFPIKPALRYIPTARLGWGRGSQGASYYAASNPPFGAVFTYRLKEKVTSRRERRKEAEKKDPDAPYPTPEALRAEDEERDPSVVLTVRDEEGAVVRRVPGSRSKGLHRTAWDLRYPSSAPVGLGRTRSGPLVVPGTYTVEIAKEVDGVVTTLVEPTEFEVVALDTATFAAEDKAAVLAFQKKVARLQRAVGGALRAANDASSRLGLARAAVIATPDADPGLLAEVQALESRLNDLLVELRGDRSRSRRMYPTAPSINGRVQSIVGDQFRVTSPPTRTQLEAYDAAGAAFERVLADLRSLIEDDLTSLDARLEEAGAPWTPGRLPDWERE
jgi:photosystem II stability/assembly factor-like uncharacterized protein